MKKLSLLVLFMLFFNTTAAQTTDKAIAGYHVDMKCYIELLGGDFMLHRNYHVPIADLKNYQVSLKSHNDMKIRQKNKQGKVIYKVLECKKMHEMFKREAAAKLDKLEKNMG